MGYYNYYRSEIWKIPPLIPYLFWMELEDRVRASLEGYMKRCYGWVCEDGKPEEEMLLHCNDDEPITNQVKQKGIQGQDSR
eukprot:scaffold6804_cov57-Cyclotella_meneghiniana.AAC.8